jgi:hypothetical protein
LNQFNPSILISGLFNRENRKAAIILLSTPVILTTYRYYGTKDFYLNYLTSVFPLFGDRELTWVLYIFFSSLVLLGLLPALMIKFIFREPWFLVSNSIHFFRRKKTDLEFRWVNRISGILITGFGLVILLSLLFY